MMLEYNTMMVICITAAFAIIAVLIVLFWIYRVMYCDKNSHSNSTVTREVGLQVMPQGLIEFPMKKLKQATNNFHKNNIIGLQSYGFVYSGMIGDMIVAIKDAWGPGHPRFLSEVSYMSQIQQHSNVVNLVGYCCEEGHQILVFEYLVNGSLRDYLDDDVDLTFKERISIALGAAKGLQHLHNLTPPIQHKRFTTAKVLLDADLNAKVSDAGMFGLVQRLYSDLRHYNPIPKGGSEETIDVYSFGLFLLELITGETPREFKSNDEIIQWIDPRLSTNTLLDERITTGTFPRESLNSFMKITMKCLKYPPTNRANMDVVVTELEKIYQNEVVSEDHGVTPGSELFTITIE